VENLGRCAARVLDLCRPINGFGVKTHNQDVFTMSTSTLGSCSSAGRQEPKELQLMRFEAAKCTSTKNTSTKMKSVGVWGRKRGQEKTTLIVPVVYIKIVKNVVTSGGSLKTNN